jgi:hypothetical protein
MQPAIEALRPKKRQTGMISIFHLRHVYRLSSMVHRPLSPGYTTSSLLKKYAISIAAFSSESDP